jgi:hypothetical protein
MILLEIFLYYPSHAIYYTLENKILGKKLLNKLPDCAQKQYFLFNEENTEELCKSAIKFALQEKNNRIFYNTLFKSKKTKDFIKNVAIYIGQNNDTKKLKYLLEFGIINFEDFRYCRIL